MRFAKQNLTSSMSNEKISQVIEKVSTPNQPPVSAGEGFIVLLDALGTRGIWTVDDPQRVLQSRLRLKDFINRSFIDFKVTTPLGEDNEPSSREMAEVKLRTRFLSDTVIVSIVPSTSVDMMILLAAIARLIGALFAEAVRDGVLYRGAISAGKFYSSEDILIGPAVDEAADWAYRGDWAGVMLTPSAERITREAVGGDRQHPFGLVHWDVPVKSVTGQSNVLRGTFVVAWPLWAAELWPQIDSLFLRPPVPLDVEIKHRNTMSFYFDVRSGKVSVDHKFTPKSASTIRTPPPKMPAGWGRRPSKSLKPKQKSGEKVTKKKIQEDLSHRPTRAKR